MYADMPQTHRSYKRRQRRKRRFIFDGNIYPLGQVHRKDRPENILDNLLDKGVYDVSPAPVRQYFQHIKYI